jgi:hypothetical protein
MSAFHRSSPTIKPTANATGPSVTPLIRQSRGPVLEVSELGMDNVGVGVVELIEYV